MLPGEANIADGRISILTPMGAALYGLAAGHCIDWPDLSGLHRPIRIVRVEQSFRDRIIGGSTMPKIRLKPALIGAAAVFAWFFAVRHGAPVWVLQSILIVAVVGGIAVVAHAMKRQRREATKVPRRASFDAKLTPRLQVRATHGNCVRRVVDPARKTPIQAGFAPLVPHFA